QIWSALERVHLADIVRSKGEGLEYGIVQGGANFSVGQRQLFCIARALLKRARVLVLDEATAAIDRSTDEVIQKTIRSEFKECTMLTIAHRLDTVIDSDMILVIDNGSVAEYDTPGNLLKKKNSVFSLLVAESRAQAAVDQSD
ncbi:ATPase-like protein, partial [Coemansia sp. RSA 2603]